MNNAERDELLSRIDERTGNIVSRLNKLPCAKEIEHRTEMQSRLAVLESQAGRRNGVAGMLGALGAGIVLGLKYLLGKV